MKKMTSRRSGKERAQLLRAALLRPKNVFILATGCVAGFFASPFLIPIGCLAYGVLCYLDLNSEEFVNAVLHPSSQGVPARKTLQPTKLTLVELHELRTRLTITDERLQQLYQDPTIRAEQILGEHEHLNRLIEKSLAFLEKAQSIWNYLNGHDVSAIQHEIERLQQKIGQVDDEFAQHQYQQAVEARCQQLDTLRDMQRMYDRLVSQVTNIIISLESVHVSVMKLNAVEDSLAQLESEQVSEQLTDLLEDVKQLEYVLREVLV